MNSFDRLWNLPNILRGEVDVHDYKRIIFPLFVFKALNDNEGDPYVIEQEAKWSVISSSPFSLAEKIQRGFYVIEKSNEYLNGVFAQFDYRGISNSLLFQMVQVLDSIDLKRNSLPDPHPLCGTLAQWTEELWENLIRSEGKMGSSMSTPREIARLVSKLLDIQGGSFYDGTAGLGGFLIEGAKAAEANTELDLYGQEIKWDAWSFAKMNCILHGLHNVKLGFGDILDNPVWTEEGSLKKFDYIAMNPPFNLRSNKWYLERDVYGRFGRYGVPSASYADMAFVLHVVSSLKKQGRAAVVLSRGILIRGGADQKNRKALLEDDLVEAVIELPNNLYNETTIPVFILVLNKKKEELRRGKVQFILANKDYRVASKSQNALREEDICRIVDAYRSGAEIPNYSRLVSVEEIAENDWSLSISRYIEEVEVETRVGNAIISARVYQNSSIAKRKLGDVAELNRGIHLPKQEIDHEEATHWLINLSSVTKDGEIELDNLVPVCLGERKSNIHELNVGDLLLSSRGTMLKVAVVPVTAKKLLASTHFIVIRLNKLYNPYFFKAFFESPVGVHLLESYQRGTSITVLSDKDVAKIEVPDLPLAKQNELAELFRNADEEYKQRIEEAKCQHERSYLNLYQKMGIAESIIEP